MREDLRRSDDRAMKQVDEIRTVYSRELELLTNIISTLIDKDKAATAAAAAQQHRLTPAQQVWQQIRKWMQEKKDGNFNWFDIGTRIDSL